MARLFRRIADFLAGKKLQVVPSAQTAETLANWRLINDVLTGADRVTDLDAMRGPALDVKCTGCGKGLVYMGSLYEDNLRAGNSVAILTRGGRSPLLSFQENEAWHGNLCASCGSIWCPACRSPTGEVGPTPCPRCGVPTSPAIRKGIEAIQRQAPFVIGTAILFIENSNDGNLGMQILKTLQPRSYANWTATGKQPKILTYRAREPWPTTQQEQLTGLVAAAVKEGYDAKSISEESLMQGGTAYSKRFYALYLK